MKTFGTLKKWSLMKGGRLREVVAKGGSTVFETNVKCKTIKIEHFRPNLSTSVILYQCKKCMYCRYRFNIFVVARNLSYRTLDFSF